MNLIRLLLLRGRVRTEVPAPLEFKPPVRALWLQSTPLVGPWAGSNDYEWLPIVHAG